MNMIKLNWSRIVEGVVISLLSAVVIAVLLAIAVLLGL